MECGRDESPRTDPTHSAAHYERRFPMPALDSQPGSVGVARRRTGRSVASASDGTADPTFLHTCARLRLAPDSPRISATLAGSTGHSGQGRRLRRTP